jgi:hypothetical protein
VEINTQVPSNSNILQYSFIAIVGLSLNYDFEVDATSVLRIPGTVGVADLRKFYPSPTNSLIGQEEDEVAHQ